MRKRTVLTFLSLLATNGCGDNGPTVDMVPATLDFGATDCGTTALPHALVITNTSAMAFNFTTELAAGAKSRYTLIPASGAVLGLSQATVFVYSQSIPTESDVTDNLYGEMLTVTTDLPGDAPHQVAITQTAHGAIIEMGADTVDFPDVQPFGTTPATKPLTIKNTGNADVSIVVESSGLSFGFTPATETPVAAGASVSGMVQYIGGATTTEKNQLSAKVIGPMCKPSGITVASGTGSVKGQAVQVIPAVDRGRANAGGAGTLCVRTTHGQVACTGRNSYGMRGSTDDRLSQLVQTFGGGGPPPAFNDFGAFNLVETKTGFLGDVVDVKAGRGYFCALRQQHDVWCWGAFQGVHRNSNVADSTQPYATQLIASGADALALGYSNICAVREPFGNLLCVAHDFGGATSVPRSEWKLSGASAVAVSGGTGYGLITDGSVMSFGINAHGERGNNDESNAPASAVTGLANITKIVAGGTTSPRRGSRFGCALDNAQTVWCWGRNNHGQLGQGSTTNRSGGGSNTAAQVQTEAGTLANVTDLAAGQQHACAIVDGGVWCWGRGREGQIGSGNLGTGDASSVVFAEPTSPALTNAVSLGLGGRATCAVLSTGGVRCWGELGNTRHSAPTTITELEP